MGDDEHVQVPTYVPASQRELWREEAESMDMSQAEYVRTMVQAGRRSFDLGDQEEAESGTTDEPAPGPVTPGVETLKDRILETIEREGSADWQQLLADAAVEFEEPLEEAIAELSGQGLVDHRPRLGDYVVVDDGR